MDCKTVSSKFFTCEFVLRKNEERIILSFVIIREKEKKRNMNRFIPREKLGKRAKRALDQSRRQDWQGIVPVTRTIENQKTYNRKKSPRGYNDDSTGIFLIIA